MAIDTPNTINLLSWGFPPDPYRGPLEELARGSGTIVIHLIQASYYAATTALISLLIASPAGVLGGMIVGTTSWLTGLGAREVARWADLGDSSKAFLAITVCKVLIAAAIGLGALSLAGISITILSLSLLESLSFLLIPLGSIATLLSTNLPWAYASHDNEAYLPVDVAINSVGDRPLMSALPPDAREGPFGSTIGDSVSTLAFSNLCQVGYYAAVPAFLLGGVGALLGVTSWITGTVARQVAKWSNLMDKPWAMLAIVICKIFAAAAIGTAALMLLGAPISFFAALPALMLAETSLLFVLPILSNAMLISTTLPMLYQTFNGNMEAPDEPEPIVPPAITLGADLITDEILTGASESTLQLFAEMDPSLFPFIATQAIFLYAIGTKRLEEIPHFLQPHTRGFIEEVREHLPNPSPVAVAAIAPLFKTFELFNNPTSQFQTAPAVFNLFKERGYGEMQGQDSLLTTSSYQTALATIEAGATLIKDEIGPNASAHTLQLFQDRAFAFRHFIATKALFIYSLGEKRQEKIPHFFRPATREQIQVLRELESLEVFAQMQPLMGTLEEFTNAAPEDPDLSNVWTLLKSYGAEEIADDHSLLNTHCYQLARIDTAAI